VESRRLRTTNPSPLAISARPTPTSGRTDDPVNGMLLPDPVGRVEVAPVVVATTPVDVVGFPRELTLTGGLELVVVA
jgi:hypothetical protein